MCRFCEYDLKAVDIIPQALCAPDQRIRLAQDKIDILFRCINRTQTDIAEMKNHNHWLWLKRACVLIPFTLLIFLFIHWLLAGAFVKCFIVFFIGTCVCDALSYAYDDVFKEEKYDIKDAEECIAEDNAIILKLSFDIEDAKQELAAQAQSYSSSFF